MQILQFHMLLMPDGRGTFYGLGSDGRIYQYTLPEESWVSLKDMKTRMDILKGQDIASDVSGIITNKKP